MKHVVIIACLLFISGCDHNDPREDFVAVSSVMPVLNVPVKPKMDLMTPTEITEYAGLSDGLRKKLENNNELLKEYAMQLKVTLETYDDFAKTHNTNGPAIQVQNVSAQKGKK